MYYREPRTSPILVILMIVVLAFLAINLYPEAISKFQSQVLPFVKPTTPQTVVFPPEQNNQPVIQIVTATPEPTMPTEVQPTATSAPVQAAVDPQPTAQPAEVQVQDGRMITFVDGSGTPISGILVKHYIGDDLVKTLTNPNGQMKVYTDYVWFYDEWHYIEGLALITVK